MIIDIATHPITEFLAILTFAFYVFLAARGNIWCWASGFLTSFLYIFIFLGVHVTSQMFLNILYMLMSVWGWSQWTLVKGKNQHSSFGFTPLAQQLTIAPLLLLTIALLMLFLPSVFLNTHPFVDATITVVSIYATILTIYRRIESWLYWVVINATYAFVFWQGELTLTAFLYVLMSLVSVYGFINWKKLRYMELAARV